MKKKKFRKIALITLGVFIISFTSLEIYFRVMAKTEYGYLAPVMRANDQLGFTFIPDGEYQAEKGTVHFNKYGYIGSDWSLEKDPDTYRIAVIGGCNLTGVFHIVDTTYYNFPEITERRLKERGYNVEILNFGVPGESRSFYNFKTVEHEVLKFKPDIIVLENLLPYTKKDYARDEYHGYQLEYLFTSEKSKEEAIAWAEKLNRWKPATFLIDNSWVFRKLAQKYQHTHNDDLASFIKFAVKNQVSFIDDAVTGIYTMEKSVEMTQELAARLEDQSIDFKLLNYQAGPFGDSLVNFSFDHIFLETEFNKKYLYPKDNHFNNLGQMHLSDKFVEELIKIIPQEYNLNQAYHEGSK